MQKSLKRVSRAAVKSVEAGHVWPSKSVLPRLDVLESGWLTRCLKEPIHHKASNTDIYVLGSMPFSFLALNHVERAFLQVNPDRLYTTMYSPNDLETLRSFWLKFYTADDLWRKPDALKRKCLDQVSQFERNGIPRLNYVPMMLLGAPYMGDIMTWAYHYSRESTKPKVPMDRALQCVESLRSNDPLPVPEDVPPLGRKIDQLFSFIIKRKISDQELNLMPQQRSVAQVIRRAHVSHPALPALPSFIEKVEHSTMIFSPDEAQKMDRVMRTWQRFNYLFCIRKPASGAASNLIKDLGVRSDGEKRSVLVIADRILCIPFERELRNRAE